MALKGGLKCLLFPGGGINYFWQAGAATYMRNHCELSDISIVGASAGSLTATLLLAGSDMEASIDEAWKLVKEYDIENNAMGLGGVWGPCVRRWMNELVPLDVQMSRFDRLHISVTHLNVLSGSKLLANFHTREDVLDACLASVHIPFFMDGKAFATYKGASYIDGALLHLTSGIAHSLPEGVLSPTEVYLCDHQQDKEFTKRFSGLMGRLVSRQCAAQMFRCGLDYMAREHETGALPWVHSEGPSTLRPPVTHYEIDPVLNCSIASSLGSRSRQWAVDQ